MVLGKNCTRGCRFCAVSKIAKGPLPDPEEPHKLAITAKAWGLKYVVITSVCRDDLEDQGAEHFARCVAETRKENPSALIEVLIPDFSGDKSLIKQVVDAKPDVLGHNIETVERISPRIRDRRASYANSLSVLRAAKDLGQKYTKSSIMLGLGETDEEVLRTFEDLRSVNTDFISMGQYLRPSLHHEPVAEYIRPEKFEYFRKMAMGSGFKYAVAGPLVRSSYKAGEYLTRSITSK